MVTIITKRRIRFGLWGLFGVACVLGLLFTVRLSQIAQRLQALSLFPLSGCDVYDTKGKRVRNLLNADVSVDRLIFEHFFGVNQEVEVHSAAISGRTGRRAIASLAEVSGIEFVSILSISIDDSVVADLSKLSDLRRLQLVECRVSEAQLREIESRLPRCVVRIGSRPLTGSELLISESRDRRVVEE
jgi:hypothetical protein